MRNFFTYFITFCAMVNPLHVAGANYTVYGIKNDFPMADNQTLFKDIYINMGTNQGIKPGSTLDAYRTMSTVDELNQKNAQSISFKIARLKVIHSDASVSVARIIEMLPPQVTPVGGYPTVMVGDSVDISRK